MNLFDIIKRPATLEQRRAQYQRRMTEQNIKQEPVNFSITLLGREQDTREYKILINFKKQYHYIYRTHQELRKLHSAIRDMYPKLLSQLPAFVPDLEEGATPRQVKAKTAKMAAYLRQLGLFVQANMLSNFSAVFGKEKGFGSGNVIDCVY